LQKIRPRIPAKETLSSVYLPIFSHPPAVNRLNIFSQQLLHVANSNFYTNAYINYLLTSLLIELSEQTITRFRMSEDSVADKNLAKIMEWIRIHVFDEITVTQIAELFNYNKDYLSRFFKQKTGMNLIEYIHLLKIANAKDLLTRTTQSIKEVSYSVGIADEKYFLRLFKRYEKVTPTQFRKAFFRTNMNNGSSSQIRI
jgi:YesN/AraC family two-component response regulator